MPHDSLACNARIDLGRKERGSGGDELAARRKDNIAGGYLTEKTQFIPCPAEGQKRDKTAVQLPERSAKPMLFILC